MSYESVWYAWGALVVVALVLTFAVIRWRSPLAKNALLFVVGFVFGQVCLLLIVGIPWVLAVAFTEGGATQSRLLAVAAVYVIGAVAFFAIGRVCATNPLLPVTWWFIAGAGSTFVLGIVRTLASLGSPESGGTLTSAVLSVVLGAALVAGYAMGRKRRAGAPDGRLTGRPPRGGSEKGQ